MGSCVSVKHKTVSNLQTTAKSSFHKDVLTPDQIHKKLMKVPLLRNIPGNFLETLSHKVKIKTYEEDEHIIREKETGHEFYIIVSGEVTIQKEAEQPNIADISIDASNPPKTNPTPTPIVLATLTDRDYFGEIALLRDVTRTASAVSVGRTSCIVLDRELFTQTKKFIKFPKRKAVFHATIQNFSLPDVKPQDYVKSPEDTKIIEKALSARLLLTAEKNPIIKKERMRRLIEYIAAQKFSKGDQVIKEGEEGHFFYVVAEGKFAIKKDDVLLKVAEIGDSFGELALLHNVPRNASIICEEDGRLWALHRVDFQRIVRKISKEKFNKIVEFLSRVKIFDRLITSERTILASVLTEETYQEHSEIIKEGEIGDCMYIIQKGTVQVNVKVTENKSNSNTNQEIAEELKQDMGKLKKSKIHDSISNFLKSSSECKEVNRLTVGDYFGEIALLKDAPRNATIAAINGPVVLLKLTKNQFNSYCGTLIELMERQIVEYKESKNKLELKFPKIERSNVWNAINLVDLKVIGQLGSGSFGEVKLVEVSKTNLGDLQTSEEDKKLLEGTFALKCLSKQKIIELGQQDHVINERVIMGSIQNNFIVKLIRSFRSEGKVFMLMEACLGGELFSRLRVVSSFNEYEARFYLANVIQAIEYLHSFDIVYRDLKPENLLIADNGYLKLADLGFSKKVIGKTWTLCGTPDYLAPEIVGGNGHGKPADIWTLGVLLYEMLVSYPPFYDEDQGETYVKIIHSEPDIPSYISKHAKNLIQRLLQKKEYKRIGTTKKGINEIKEHSFFKGFDWNKLQKFELKAPHIPCIKSSSDISNFDESFATTALLDPNEMDNSNNGVISEWETHF